jgi:ribosome-associated protein
MTTSTSDPKKLDKRGLPAALKTAAKAALDKKAEDLRILDLRGTAAFTDYFILMHGNSGRHNAALADAMEESLRQAKIRPLGIEGRLHGEWILLDYGSFIIHVFSRAARDYYAMEKLWADAPRAAY